MGKLTAVAVRNAIKAAAPVRLMDGEGLRLVIDKASRAYWILRFRAEGKDYERSLGRAEDLPLSEAREKARLARAAILAPPEAEQKVIVTFKEAAEDYIAVIAPTLKSAIHLNQWRNTLRDYAYPHFGEKPVNEVGESDITDALRPIWLTKRETAGRVLQRIRAILAAAKGKGWRSTMVDWDAVRAALPKAKKTVKHMASIPFSELPDFYGQLDLSTATPIVRTALRFLTLTAVRPGNVVQARWDDIAKADGSQTWLIPADQMKSGVDFRCPLSPDATALLKLAEKWRVPEGSPGHELVFPAASGEVLSADTMRMAMRRMGLSATPHGMRSAFKDWSLAKGYPDHLSELALAHADVNKVRAAYARTDLLEERRAMMVAWAAFLTGG